MAISQRLRRFLSMGFATGLAAGGLVVSAKANKQGTDSEHQQESYTRIVEPAREEVERISVPITVTTERTKSLWKAVETIPGAVALAQEEYAKAGQKDGGVYRLADVKVGGVSVASMVSNLDDHGIAKIIPYVVQGNAQALPRGSKSDTMGYAGTWSKDGKRFHATSRIDAPDGIPGDRFGAVGKDGKPQTLEVAVAEFTKTTTHPEKRATTTLAPLGFESSGPDYSWLSLLGLGFVDWFRRRKHVGHATRATRIDVSHSHVSASAPSVPSLAALNGTSVEDSYWAHVEKGEYADAGRLVSRSQDAIALLERLFPEQSRYEQFMALNRIEQLEALGRMQGNGPLTSHPSNGILESYLPSLARRNKWIADVESQVASFAPSIVSSVVPPEVSPVASPVSSGVSLEASLASVSFGAAAESIPSMPLSLAEQYRTDPDAVLQQIGLALVTKRRQEAVTATKALGLGEYDLSTLLLRLRLTTLTNEQGMEFHGVGTLADYLLMKTQDLEATSMIRTIGSSSALPERVNPLKIFSECLASGDYASAADLVQRVRTPKIDLFAKAMNTPSTRNMVLGLDSAAVATILGTTPEEATTVMESYRARFKGDRTIDQKVNDAQAPQVPVVTQAPAMTRAPASAIVPAETQSPIVQSPIVAPPSSAPLYEYKGPSSAADDFRAAYNRMDTAAMGVIAATVPSGQRSVFAAGIAGNGYTRDRPTVDELVALTGLPEDMVKDHRLSHTKRALAMNPRRVRGMNASTPAPKIATPRPVKTAQPVGPDYADARVVAQIVANHFVAGEYKSASQVLDRARDRFGALDIALQRPEVLESVRALEPSLAARALGVVPMNLDGFLKKYDARPDRGEDVFGIDSTGLKPRKRGDGNEGGGSSAPPSGSAPPAAGAPPDQGPFQLRRNARSASDIADVVARSYKSGHGALTHQALAGRQDRDAIVASLYSDAKFADRTNAHKGNYLSVDDIAAATGVRVADIRALKDARGLTRDGYISERREIAQGMESAYVAASRDGVDTRTRAQFLAETARSLGVSESTVRRDLKAAPYRISAPASQRARSTERPAAPYAN